MTSKIVGVVLGVVVLGVFLAFLKKAPVDVGTIPESRDIVLAVGQTGTYDNLSIRLNEIESDSRCPAGVACIWAGAVTASVTLESNGQKMTSAIVSNTAPVKFGGYSISITDVIPPTHSGLPILPRDYRVTFHVD